MWTPRERPCLRPRAAARDSPTPRWLVPAHLPGRSHPQLLTCMLGPTNQPAHLPLYLSESAPSTLTSQRPPTYRTLTDEAFDGRSRARRNATFPPLSKPRRDKTRHIWHCGTRSPKCRGRVCSPRSSLQVSDEPQTQGLNVIQVICVQCGETFSAKRRSKRYCSEECRQAWRSDHQVTCPGCGQLFTPSRASQVYCTAACRERSGRRARYARGREHVRAYTRAGAEGERSATCPVCAQVFTPARSSQVYCSPACRRARAGAARTRAASMTAAARACALIARLHVPGVDGVCAECAHPWPCETRRLTEAVTGGERP